MRRALTGLLVAALAGGLAACGGSSGGGGGSSGGGAVTLTLVEHQQLRAQALQQLLPKFEKQMAASGQQIKVKLVQNILPDDQFKTKLTQDYNAGNAADVAEYGSVWVPDFSSAKYLLDLTSYVQKWPDWQRFYPVLRKQMTSADNKVYGIPAEANTQALFYRKDVLDRLGVSTAQPTTWDELISRLTQVRAKTGKPPIVVPAGTAWGDGTFGEGFLNLALGTATPVFDTGANKWVVQGAGLRYVFDLYAKLTSAKLLPTDALLNPQPWQPTKYTAFPKGDLLVTTQGTWGWTYDWGPKGAAPIPDLFKKVAVWLIPAQSGPPYVQASTGWAWTVSAKTQHPAEAVKLVQWLTTGPALAEHVVAVGAASPRDDLQNVAPYSGKSYLIEAEKQLAVGKIFTPEPGLQQYSQAVQRVTQDIISGRRGGAAAATEFAATATDLLGKDNVVQKP